MCGRYVSLEDAEFEREYSLTPIEALRELQKLFRQNFNASPSQKLPVIRQAADGGRELDLFTWGFQPSWAERGWINARAETVFESRAFKSAALRQRCLVPAIGWYEWQGTQTPKQPYFLHIEDRRPFAFAGIWTARTTDAGTTLTFAILTMAAAPNTAHIHGRMPVILPASPMTSGYHRRQRTRAH